ncbi:hypothetical protein ACHAXM_001514 [Skeletonema potamos]
MKRNNKCKIKIELTIPLPFMSSKASTLNISSRIGKWEKSCAVVSL